MKVRDYRDLIVWQRACELVRLVYPIARALPTEERFALASQVRRSAVSVVANIVEGHSRSRRAGFLQFLSIAYGSLRELESHLVVAGAAGYVSRARIADPRAVASQVSRMLVAMRRALGDPAFPARRDAMRRTPCAGRSPRPPPGAARVHQQPASIRRSPAGIARSP